MAAVRVVVDVAVAREVQDLDRSIQRDAVLEEVRAAALLDGQRDRQCLRRLQDAELFELVVELGDAARRGGHENHEEVGVCRLSRRGGPAETALEAERTLDVACQEAAVVGQQLPGCVEEAQLVVAGRRAGLEGQLQRTRAGETRLQPAIGTV